MDDAKILAEVESRIREQSRGEGWFEERAGFLRVLRLIEKLRKDGSAPEDYELG
jgi:hypothetical protein